MPASMYVLLRVSLIVEIAVVMSSNMTATTINAPLATFEANACATVPVALRLFADWT